MYISTYAPYPEAAISSITRVSRAQGILAQSFNRPRGREAWRGLARQRREGSRFSSNGFPEIHVIGTSDELLRQAAKAARVPQHVQVALMYRQYRRFDQQVARLRMKEAHWAIGMPGGCLGTFLGNAHVGGLNIFHAVNAHPLAHNDALLSQYGVRAVSGELIPTRIVDRIAQELSLSDIVLSPSSANSRGFERYGVDPSKIITMGYGVDWERFSLPDNAQDDRRPADDVLRALFVGQISYRKGVDALLSAFHRLGDGFQLFLAGPLVSPALLRRLPRNVVYGGALPQSELTRLYSSADVFVLPSLEDACALVTFEAAASGLPVVTSAENGASEYLDPSILNLCSPADDASIASVLSGARRLTAEARARNRSVFLERRCVPDWAAYGSSVLERLKAG